MVLVFHVHSGRRVCDDYPCRAVPARHAVGRTRLFQPDDHLARSGDGVRGDHAFLRRPRQLDDSDDDRCAGHGAATDEQLELLDPAAGVFDSGGNAVHGRRRAQLRLDVLRAVVDNLCTAFGHLLHFLHSRARAVVHHGVDQHHRHRDEHACPRHDLHEDAAVRLDVADHCIPAGGGDAGARGRRDHDADGYSLRHQLLLRRRRW